MIKFVTEEEQKSTLTFDMVEKNQFFIDGGYLCQKINDTSYIVIANKDKSPHTIYVNCVHFKIKIDKILPKVTRIEF